MEYIHGRTGDQILGSTSIPAERKGVYQYMATAIQKLLRIPIPPELPPPPPPSALNNDVFRLVMFLDTEAPRIYQNADQLELHLNTIFITAHDICFTELLYLHMGSIYEQLKGLSNEPMVFCYGDIHPGNFIINDDGHITIIDFSETSILPSSFARYAIVSTSKLSRG
ncbi:hypothetical protein H105_00760 [Trichophyton soudanense CBS 452.61]|uniref:Aminoglycoside phosphotransferase domain-containing protein n=1 Tax=Trichophyton soudanense CBS 452.61 TaxID=1215331 RepID=A0A022Y5R1_TRISD|nr:hypothetical protein H105_00760 [Trichophyton soudanense CBS 452.61]